jgi:serine/threonine protein phosphatase PrpC
MDDSGLTLDSHPLPTVSCSVSSQVDDKMSGTTAISVNFHGNIVAISNVGDSRAVLGHRITDDGGTGSGKQGGEEKAEIGDANVEMAKDDKFKSFPNDGKLLAIPLSRDQTPYRKDERERVKKLGAAIMSIDQMEGHEEMHENWGDMVMGQDVDIHGDPPRVWMEGKDYPGAAFTRSIGDNLAEDVGVTAEPEMLARELTANDHILVIASDGIFEFLTNQEVIDVCVDCETPLQASEKLVKMAYDQWLVYENRTDDITVIVCFLSCNKPPPTDGAEGTTEDLVVLAKSIYGNKPVRKKPRNNNDNLMAASMAPFAVAAAELDQNGLSKVRFDEREENYNENETKTP